MTLRPDTRSQRLESNIWKYYCLRVFAKRLVFPILTIFLVRNQLSASEIGTVFAVGTLIGLFFEVPSGTIADRIGRKASLTISFLIQAVSMLTLGLSTEFWGFLVGNALYFIGGSLLTGTHEAFVYETLHELDREKDLKKIVGKALFVSQIVTGILFIGIPVIATYSLSLPFFMNAVVFLGVSILAMTFVEPNQARSVAKQESLPSTSAFKDFLANPTLLSFSLALGALSGANGVLEDFRQIYLNFIHFDLAFFGLVYLALRLLTGFVGTRADWLEGKIGKTATLFVLPSISLVTYAGLSLFNTWFGLIFIALDGIMNGLLRPIEQEYLQKMVLGDKRVTMLSVDNLIKGLFRAGSVFLAGIIVQRFGVQAGFIFSCSIVLLVAVPLLIRFVSLNRRLPTRIDQRLFQSV